MQRRRRGQFEVVQVEQANLFHPKRERPAWETLPAETQKDVTKLIARLLSSYQARRAAASAEVQHD